MRLAILQQSYGRFGGAERLAFSHYAQLKRMGVEVTFYYTGRISPGWKERLREDLPKGMPTGFATSPRRLREVVWFLEELKNYDRIIIHHHVEPTLAFYLSKCLGARIIWYSGSVFELPWEDVILRTDYRRISPTVRRTSREFYGALLSDLLLSDYSYRMTKIAAKTLDIATARGYGKILANSRFLSEFLTRAYGLKKRPSIVHPAADPLLEKLASVNHFRERDYMAVVGSLIPVKNVDTIIRAAAKVESSKIVIVGEGQEMSRLKELAYKNGVSVEFRGTVDREEDLAQVYGECKFLVHLSLYEPFGLTPVEAGLFSKSSIVTNQGGPPEVVIDKVTGYLVGPKDHASVRSRMRTLLDDDSLRHGMGQRARQNVLEKFTLERSTNRLLEEVEAG